MEEEEEEEEEEELEEEKSEGLTGQAVWVTVLLAVKVLLSITEVSFLWLPADLLQQLRECERERERKREGRGWVR